MLRYILTVAVLVVLALLAYIRLAPASVEVWHKMPPDTGPGDYLEEAGFRAARQVSVPVTEVLQAVETRALATPRTRLFAGSVDEGMLTFVTRSRVMGFPDYTTVTVQGDVLVIYGRLRFGRSDLGVNRARVAGWLETLGPLTKPL